MSPSWLLILELTLPMAILVAIMAWLLFRRRGTTQVGAQALLKEIKANEEANRTALSRYLKDTLLMSAEEAEKHLTSIMAKRRQFFKAVLDSHLSPSSDSIGKLEKALSELTNAYHALTPAAAYGSPTEVMSSAHANDVQYLREENDRLKKEVSITLGTLNNIFSEYSSMLGEEGERKDMKVEDILAKMESMTQEVEPEPEPAEAALAETISAETAESETPAPEGDDVNWDDAFAEAVRNLPSEDDDEDKK